MAVEFFKEKASYAFSALRYLIGFLYSDKNVEKSILVAIAPQREAVRLDCAGRTLNIWINIYNFSPFKFKMEHLVLRFYYAGFSLQVLPDAQYMVGAFSHTSLCLKANLDADQAAAAASAQDSSTSIECNLSLSSKWKSISKKDYFDQFPFFKINTNLPSL